MLSTAVTSTIGVVLLTIVAIAFGGTFLLRVMAGEVPTNTLQKSFFRAGHAHAGVLVTLGIVVLMFVDLAGVSGLARALSSGVLWGAILMPAGFFLSVTGRDPQKPNHLYALIWAGAACVVLGVVAAGVGALTV